MINPLDMKGLTCHFPKCQIHIFISKGTWRQNCEIFQTYTIFSIIEKVIFVRIMSYFWHFCTLQKCAMRQITCNFRLLNDEKYFYKSKLRSPNYINSFTDHSWAVLSVYQGSSVYVSPQVYVKFRGNIAVCNISKIPGQDGEHERLHQYWFDVGPSSNAVGQPQPSIGWTSRICWL